MARRTIPRSCSAFSNQACSGVRPLIQDFVQFEGRVDKGIGIAALHARYTRADGRNQIGPLPMSWRGLEVQEFQFAVTTKQQVRFTHRHVPILPQRNVDFRLDDASRPGPILHKNVVEAESLPNVPALCASRSSRDTLFAGAGSPQQRRANAPFQLTHSSRNTA